MKQAYTESVAEHYAVYRPPLHQRILKLALADVCNISDGLDIGCGTGRSSVALAQFCDRVYAIDSSKSMLDCAARHNAITYLNGTGENMPIPMDSVDVATFAGSLPYMDIDAVVRELSRVCRNNALVIPYDFELEIDSTLQAFGIPTPTQDSSYNHKANFNGIPPLKEKLVVSESIELAIRTTDLAHILLADSARHDAFANRYKTTRPHFALAKELGSDEQIIIIEANLFYAVYQIDSEPRRFENK